MSEPVPSQQRGAEESKRTTESRVLDGYSSQPADYQHGKLQCKIVSHPSSAVRDSCTNSVMIIEIEAVFWGPSPTVCATRTPDKYLLLSSQKNFPDLGFGPRFSSKGVSTRKSTIFWISGPRLDIIRGPCINFYVKHWEKSPTYLQIGSMAVHHQQPPSINKYNSGDLRSFSIRITLFKSLHNLTGRHKLCHCAA